MSDLRLAELAERADTYDRPAGSPIPRHPRRRHGQPPGGTIDLDAKANGAASRAGGQYEVEIAGVKTVGDAARGIVQRGELAADRPSAGQAPVVEQQRRYCAIDARSICGGAAGRNEVPGLVIADVGLILAQIALIRGGLSGLSPRSARSRWRRARRWLRTAVVGSGVPIRRNRPRRTRDGALGHLRR